MAKLAALPYALLPVVYFLPGGVRSLSLPLHHRNEPESSHLALSLRNRRHRTNCCTPTAAAHGGSHQPEHDTRMPSRLGRACLGCWIRSTSIRRKARLPGRDFIRRRQSCQRNRQGVMQGVSSARARLMTASNAVSYPKSKLTKSSRGKSSLMQRQQLKLQGGAVVHLVVLRLWPKRLPNTTSGALLPATGQGKLPSCSSAIAQMPAHVLAEVSCRALLRAILDAVAPAT